MRPRFRTIEEHNETILENFKMDINKRDSLILLGDVAHNVEMLMRIAEIKCVKKTLILGNHDTDQGIPLTEHMKVFDEIHSLHSRRNVWFSHSPIHPQAMRNKVANIHGHFHGEHVWMDSEPLREPGFSEINPRYINVCVEQTDYRPISFADAMSGVMRW